MKTANNDIRSFMMSVASGKNSKLLIFETKNAEETTQFLHEINAIANHSRTCVIQFSDFGALNTVQHVPSVLLEQSCNNAKKMIVQKCQNHIGNTKK